MNTLKIRKQLGHGQSFEAIHDGKMAFIKDTVEQVTGRAPRTFESWAQEHAPRLI
jgi:hypothetical protein